MPGIAIRKNWHEKILDPAFLPVEILDSLGTNGFEYQCFFGEASSFYFPTISTPVLLPYSLCSFSLIRNILLDHVIYSFASFSHNSCLVYHMIYLFASFSHDLCLVCSSFFQNSLFPLKNKSVISQRIFVVS